MANKHHREILEQIRKKSGTPTQHTLQDSYLGNKNPRYLIDIPTLRKIAREWMNEHREMSVKEFSALLTSLNKGKSSTEKTMTGLLLDIASADQRSFDPKLFSSWLDNLTGWAEIDCVCTGKYTKNEITRNWKKWKPQLIQFSKSKNISKRRASIVMLCSPLRNHKDAAVATLVLTNIEKLKHEKDVLITKAISWVLRSMVKHFPEMVNEYVEDNRSTLPAIAVRETLVKLKTGRKTKKKITH